MFPLYFGVPSLNWSVQSQSAFPTYNQTKESEDIKNQYLLLKLKYDELLKQNQALKSKLREIQPQQPAKLKKTVNRRKQEDIVRNIACCYENCQKQYASEIALNLHIKQKHRGGTKRKRQQYARAIIMAQKRNQPIPHSQIVLPPGYLEQFKNTLVDHLNSDSQILYSEESQ